MHPIEHLRYVARARGADATSLVRESAMALGSLRADHRNLVVACRRIVERHPSIGPLWWMSARMLVDDDPSELAWDLADEIDDDAVPRAIAAALPDAPTVVTIGWPEVAGDALMRRGDAHVLCADAEHEASSFLQRLERCDVACDPVPAEWLAHATRRADLVMVDALAVSERRAIAPLGSGVLAAVARSTGTPVWLAAGVGRRLPVQYVDEIADRVLPDGDGDGSDGDGGARDGGDGDGGGGGHAADSGPGLGFGFGDVSVEELPLGLVTHVADGDGVSEIGPGALRPDAPFAPELLRTSPM